jgi:hypothetical protein
MGGYVGFKSYRVIFEGDIVNNAWKRGANIYFASFTVLP